MRFTLRRAAALCAACVLLCLCGCGHGGEDTPTATEPSSQADAAQIRYNDLRLPYVRADSLDPFYAKTVMNRQLTTLLYDSLFTLDGSFEAKPLIAKEYTTDNYSILVTINSDVRFTNGASLTVGDVIYSFGQAKASNAYKARLRSFTEAVERGDNAVLFTLSDVDPYAVACLDFPIIQSGTSRDDRRKAQQAETTAEDGAAPAKTIDQVVPVGSGRYVLSYEESETDPVLTANNARFKGFYPAMSVIHLVNVTDSSALFYSLEIGNISFAFDDLASGKYTRVNASITEYPMNSFVFLGMNQDDPALAQPAVRQAILAAIDLENVLNVAFQGHATVTHTPFNPLWTMATAYESTWVGKRQDAAAILKEAGFDQVNTYGIRNNGRLSLTFDMVISADNEFKRMAAQQIAKNLRALKINVKITEVAAEDVRSVVERGAFDLYIGEVNLSANMNLEPFFGGSGALAHGIWSRSAAEAYAEFLAGEINFDAFMEAFCQDVPFVPLCYRKGIAASVKELQGTQNANYSDLFADIETWHF